MKIPYDYVAIKPFPSDEIRTKSGHVLYLDVRFEEYLHAQTAGIVSHAPEKLRFNGDPERNSMDFDTDIEVKEGDVVIFNYLAAKLARKEGRILDGGMLLIPYDKIYVAMRGDEVIPVNGHILVEPEYETVESTVIIPDSNIDRSKQLGRILYAGKPNKGYRNDLFVKGFTSPDTPVNVGQRILFHWTDAIPLQPVQEIHGEVTREKFLYRMQHKDIMALVPDEAKVVE